MAKQMTQPLRLCLVDMNNGVANEATRCFRRLFDGFVQRVRAVNPDLPVQFRHVQPRNLGELPDRGVDLVLSSGGPGSPYDGYEDPWCVGYRKFLDELLEANLKDPATAPQAFVVCHSFEITITHLKVAEMTRRETLKFAIMPAYPTAEGMKDPLFAPFGERLFVWEHRRWQAVNLNERRLAELGGTLLCRESRPGRTDKGEALVSFRFAPGLVGTQFHPEADRPGVMAWINRPEHAADLRDAYGNALYERMIKTLDDPTRLARTYALLIPTWLQIRFNELAKVRGLKPITPPEQDMREFDEHRPAVAV
jgi:GMP synthase-like glutamine amidotransferase